MAQTAGKQNGTLSFITRAGTKITHLTESSAEWNMALIGATTKDSAGWEEHLRGLRSMTMSVSAAFADDATEGAFDLIDEIINGTSATYVYGTGVVGDSVYTITGWVTNVSDTGGVEDLRTFSASFTATGTPTKTVVV